MPEGHFVRDLVFSITTIVVGSFVALRTELVFRALGRGTDEQNKPSAFAMKVIQYIAAFMAISSGLNLLFTLVGLVK